MLVQPQVQEQVDRQRNVDDERDGVTQVPRDLRLFNLDIRADLGDPAGSLSDGFHREFAARDIGERGSDTFRGNGYLEESATEPFVGQVVVVLHRLIPSHVSWPNSS